MGNCLVTKLKGTVLNTELLKFKEMRILLDESSSNKEIKIAFNKETEVYIIGDAYFTSSSDSNDNLGKTNTVTATETENTSKVLYITGAKCYFCISDKEALTSITLPVSANYYLKDFRYCKNLSILYSWNVYNAYGDLSELSNLTNLKNLTIGAKNLSGSLGDLKNLKNLSTLRILSEGNSGITGDISDLKGLPLNIVALDTLSITGDISVFKSCKTLTYMYLGATNTVGNISSLQDLPLQCLGLNPNIVVGDYATLPNSLSYISSGAPGGTWSNRSAPANVLCTPDGYSNSVTSDNVDKVLNDLATCNDYAYLERWQKKLMFPNAKKSSASDAAVAQLQSRGYTVQTA